ncbi:hypothetical protein ACFL23_00675 [Patescibacteria group bacterium]
MKYKIKLNFKNDPNQIKIYFDKKLSYSKESQTFYTDIMQIPKDKEYIKNIFIKYQLIKSISVDFDNILIIKGELAIWKNMKEGILKILSEELGEDGEEELTEVKDEEDNDIINVFSNDVNKLFDKAVNFLTGFRTKLRKDSEEMKKSNEERKERWDKNHKEFMKQINDLNQKIEDKLK